MLPSSKNKIVIALIVLVAIGIGLFVFVKFFKSAPAPDETETILPVSTAPVQKVIGKTVEGRNIESYTYGSGEKLLLFVGGIHGGYEWNSVILAYTFMDYLNANPTAIPANVSVTIIPSANPDAVFKVTGKEGRFIATDVLVDAELQAQARFNSNGVDLNRNFDCKWQPESTWRQQVVSAGTAVFSEPEAQAIRNFVLENNPDAVVFWHSQSNAVYASACEFGVLPETTEIMNAYSVASGYPKFDNFTNYSITGDSTDWLASINVPAITVELSTHEVIEWEKNLAGIRALFDYYSRQI